jgi:hypothetical protein
MRLTNYIRHAFVRAAMNDVPQVDYQQQARDLFKKTCIDALPKELQSLYTKFPSYFREQGMHVSNVGYLYGPMGDGKVKLSEKTLKRLQDLETAERQQREHRRGLETKLKAVALSVTTRKALAEALPEFEKYLPAPEVPHSKSVPALTNVVHEFVKAGWPKNQKKPAKRTQAPVPTGVNTVIAL